MIVEFFHHLQHYIIEIIPALIVGFLLSGIINEFVPTTFVEKHLGERGIKPILYSTIIGTIVPVCCWGSLPIAVSFYLKGASLGPILAFLVATPATSVNALIVVAKFLGLKFAIYTFFSVILMGVVMGMIGNLFKVIQRSKFNVQPGENETCSCCEKEKNSCNIHVKKNFKDRILSILKYAFITMPKEIGLETFAGLVLAALVATINPVGIFIKKYFTGIYGYLFALIFGILMYMCATMSVPLVDAFINQGLNIGAGFVLLIVGPITSYGTILVIRKEFGLKILLVYLATISILALILGYIYSLL
jgi:uncharacterized membrane protein YraQ (UPF0718 family)